MYQQEKVTHIDAEQVEPQTSGKQPFEEPKLTFVEPELTKQGDFVEVTEGFFGPFTPPSSI